MFIGTRVKFAIESTMGGLVRARQQWEMDIPHQAFAALLRSNQHTCKHIMQNRKCSAFEAVARTCAVLHWSLVEAEQVADVAGPNPLIKDFEDAIIMALSKDGEGGRQQKWGMAAHVGS